MIASPRISMVWQSPGNRDGRCSMRPWRILRQARCLRPPSVQSKAGRPSGWTLVRAGGSSTRTQRGLASAFGWVEQNQLRGIVVGLLAAPSPFLRTLGIGACAMHRIDPGQVRDVALEAPSSALRARALRACGELGRRELLPSCLGMLNAEDSENPFWSAWSAVLLGNRGPALDALRAIGSVPGQHRSRAFRLGLQATDQQNAQSWLRQLAQDPEQLRFSIQGAGIAGNPKYVPWLIQH